MVNTYTHKRQHNMTTEYQRLGGYLPHEIEALVKEYAQPRYMKPIPQVIAQIKMLNRDGGILSTWDDGTRRSKGASCWLVQVRVILYGTKAALKQLGPSKFHGPF